MVLLQSHALSCCIAVLVAATGSHAQQCPMIAEKGCFDQEFTCERCCDTRAIPTGDLACWYGPVKFATCCGVTRIRMAAAQMLPAMDRLETTAACPPAAQPHCFDDYFPCERCCDTRRGPEGDIVCWPESTPYGVRTLTFAFCCGMVPFAEVERLPWTPPESLQPLPREVGGRNTTYADE
mmetsp:Transcript_48397/g.89132  ORF Transcript_48397/g.89132 Transcript_48397/m.89132 type:complete len:180 (-) Transcript_48397:80-619(-)